MGPKPKLRASSQSSRKRKRTETAVSEQLKGDESDIDWINEQVTNSVLSELRQAGVLKHFNDSSVVDQDAGMAQRKAQHIDNRNAYGVFSTPQVSTSAAKDTTIGPLLEAISWTAALFAPQTTISLPNTGTVLKVSGQN